jgi:hypothetical protein
MMFSRKVPDNNGAGRWSFGSEMGTKDVFEKNKKIIILKKNPANNGIMDQSAGFVEMGAKNVM